MSAYGKVLATTTFVAVLAILTTEACGSSDLLVGDDGRDNVIDGATPDTSVVPDGAPGPLPDAAKDTGADVRADVTCPELIQPPPGFCDSGPFAPKYDTNACIVGFACAPVDCLEAGGKCVGLAPGSCASNHFGDAAKYSCGAGIGVGCCLP
jgi:hypothetical protein